MDGLLLLNGAEAGEIHKLIERYAFLEGFLTCDLKQYLKDRNRWGSKPVILYLDSAGLGKIHKDVLIFLSVELPVILILTEEEEGNICSDRGMVSIKMPVPMQAFHTCNQRLIEEKLLRERTLCFGDLRIDQKRHEVLLEGKSLKIRGYDYEIFLLLLENMGRVISRESINGYFPGRSRRNTRNVDTHIKNIRRQIGGDRLIQCVRSVGYCIKTEEFFRKFGSRLASD